MVAIVWQNAIILPVNQNEVSQFYYHLIDLELFFTKYFSFYMT